MKNICADVANHLSALGSNQQQHRNSSSAAPLDQLQVVLHLVTSPFFRPAVVDEQLVQTLAGFLLAVPADSSSAAQDTAGLADFRSTLLHVLEAVSQVGANS